MSDSTGVNYAYDGAGNLTGTSAGDTYTYNAWGNLTEATLNGVTTTANFDATGTRVQVDGVDQLWDRTGYGTLISSGAGDNFLHLPGGGVLRDDTDWLLRDAVGSVRHATDTTGAVTANASFTAFGEPRTTGSSVFGYAGEQTDPNTLIHLRARAYNPALGTFTAYDPVQPGGPSTAGWNHYTYAANSPTTWGDPTGQTAITKTAVITVSTVTSVLVLAQLGKGIYDVLSWLLPWLWEHIKNPPVGSWPFAGDYTDGDDSSVTNDDLVLKESWIIPPGYYRDPTTGKVYNSKTGEEVDPRSLLHENRYQSVLEEEIELAESVGVTTTRVGADDFDDAISDRTINFVVLEDGTLVIQQMFVQGEEISHAVLSEGRPVRVAGHATIAGAEGEYFGLELNARSGHFGEGNLEVALEAFEREGIDFSQ